MYHGQKRLCMKVVTFFTGGIHTVSTNEKEAMIIKNQTMERTTHCGGIGDIGLTKAFFFHPAEDK